MSTYSLKVVCNNCDQRFTVNQVKGVERPRTAECPKCGCHKITYLMDQGCYDKPRNFLAETMDVFFNGRKAR